MAAAATASKPSVTKGSRVIAAEDMRRVPEGTAGQVKMVNGLDWMRAWVSFDNGVWLGSISLDKLVPEDDWEDFKVRRVEEATMAEQRKEQAAAAAEATAALVAAGATDTAASAAASKVPAHLLERSRAARARIEAARTAGE
jgi:hypothetical protein